MGWEASGRAWGDRAVDWAYLMEPYALRANEAVFNRTGVGPGTRILDIACGSGYAAALAAQRGAEVSGLDASEELIAIARARTPAADFRIGDMFALPFTDDTGRPGVVEQVLAVAGPDFVDRGSAAAINEFADITLAVRALAAAGPSWAALHNVGEERVSRPWRMR